MTDDVSQNQSERAEISFTELVDVLLDQEIFLSPRYLFRLSDLEGDELLKLREIWLQISTQRRLRLLEDLEIFAESNSLMSFDAVCQLALTDPDSTVRQVAVRALWECDDPALVPIFLDILENDENPSTQAQAASGLGHFVYLGELGKIKTDALETIVDNLLKVMDSEMSSNTRRSALESLGYSCHPKVPKLIEDAYDYGDEEWLASALAAMGRSADEQWNPLIIDKLDHSDVKVRMKAAQAAGELSILDANPNLLHLLYDHDDEVRMAAVWALSEVGGNEARDRLDALLEETEDEDEIEHIENALDNLVFNQELQDFKIMDFSENDLDNIANNISEEE